MTNGSDDSNVTIADNHSVNHEKNVLLHPDNLSIRVWMPITVTHATFSSENPRPFRTRDVHLSRRGSWPRLGPSLISELGHSSIWGVFFVFGSASYKLWVSPV